MKRRIFYINVLNMPLFHDSPMYTYIFLFIFPSYHAGLIKTDYGAIALYRLPEGVRLGIGSQPVTAGLMDAIVYSDWTNGSSTGLSQTLTPNSLPVSTTSHFILLDRLIQSSNELLINVKYCGSILFPCKEIICVKS